MNNERGLNCVPFYFAFTCHTRGFANRLKVVWPVFRHVKAAFIRTSSQSFLSSFLLHLRKLSQISVNATRFVFERNLNDGFCVVDFFLTSICSQDGAAKMVIAANSAQCYKNGRAGVLMRKTGARKSASVFLLHYAGIFTRARLCNIESRGVNFMSPKLRGIPLGGILPLTLIDSFLHFLALKFWGNYYSEVEQNLEKK